MAEDFYGYDEDQSAPKKRDNLFLWTVFILLLIGVAFAAWLGSFYVFGHPEQPRAYRLLQKVKPLPPPVRFEVTAAPTGDFLSAQKLFERFSKFTRLELDRENANLLRDYIKNFKETKKLATYVTGRFNIIDTSELTARDFFTSGVVSLAQSVDFPQTLIEHVYTAPQENVPALRQMLQRGLDMNIKRTDDCAAVIHAARTADGRMKFTVLSVLYGTYALKQSTGMFSLEPPRELHVEAGLPIIQGPALQEAMKAHAEYRRKHPVASTDLAGNATAPPPSRELVRVDTTEPGAAVPAHGLPSATPLPAHPQTTPKPVAIAKPAATPPVLAMLATPRPIAATPAPMPVAPPPPVPVAAPRMSPTGVPLQPFNPPGAEVVARPDPSKQPSLGATWKTYAPGQAPPARILSPEDAGALAGRGMINEPLYLRGSFRVTATGANRAVLRDSSVPDEQSPRIVAEYPAGFVAPPERAIFVRDGARPFLIYDVRRGADNVITIYVREITQPTP